MTPVHRRASRPGFALAETLVVAAVLTILTGITLPVVAGMREKARQAGCAANLAQIGKALQMYSQDWDGLIPPYPVHQVAPNLERQNRLMLGALAPYTRGAGVWRCPSDPIAGESRVGTYAFHRWSSYVFAGPDPGSRPWHVDAPDPAGTRGPAQVTYAVDDTVYLVVAATRSGPRVPKAAHPGNHREGANRLFFDGHVRYRRYPDLRKTPG
jgi:prepilin-type processing-associated H-X9-DG protein